MSQAIDQRLGYHTHASGRSQSTRISLLLSKSILKTRSFSILDAVAVDLFFLLQNMQGM